MKLIGLTAYGLNVRNEKHQNLELHDIYGTTLLEYLQSIAEASVDEYAKD